MGKAVIVKIIRFGHVFFGKAGKLRKTHTGILMREESIIEIEFLDGKVIFVASKDVDIREYSG